MTDKVLHTDINTMTDDYIIGYLLTDAEFAALTVDQWKTLRGDFGLIRCPDGSYYTTSDKTIIVRVR
jgi:hypothetical protein